MTWPFADLGCMYIYIFFSFFFFSQFSEVRNPNHHVSLRKTLRYMNPDVAHFFVCLFAFILLKFK